MSLNTAYASTIPAIFKIVEVIIDIILIILVAVSPIYVVPGAGGWLFFVAILTLLISMFFYLIHLTNAIFKLAGPMTLVEFICIAICSGFHLIAMIVAAATASGIPTAIAAAVFFAVNFLIYGIDAFFLFALYRVNGAYLHENTNPNPQITPKSQNTTPAYDNTAYNPQ
ncbi:marvel-containing potential lipid raft-associated [Schistosoma japonicum]|uniref:Marvel-containing potential lipid raft-associated n=1 Tax=Schistosoma japonicum TaxID=6182 RepID=C1L602_SCHJA|nr:marvel-containing potential lipid raft-associated [Schistosoma japonicum]TNN08410.1 marvel-containing potential lipid raft-associated [Schistosoma japonicum]TNN08411.1 marvel-containing potential lipid raft-associated [Schistosoma japonicum]CAX70130.1 hypothetical protein [Schistosoma japonicum]